MIKSKQIEIVVSKPDNELSETERIIKSNKAAMAFLGFDDELDQNDFRLTPKK